MSEATPHVMSRAAVEALLAEMVAIDSTNPSLRPGAPGEAALARCLARRLAAAGLEVDVYDALPGRPNVIARLAGSAAGAAPSLLLFAHLDTVSAAPEAYAPAVREGRMYGRGAADCKAGLAAIVAVAEALAASGEPLAGDLWVAGVIDEEWGSAGAQALVERLRPGAAILAECSDLQVITEHGGFAWFEVESRGVEAAGADPDHGVDGIALLGPVLSGIAALDAELAARPAAAYGRGSIHAATIAGGDQYPVYPALCTLGVERCLIAGETVAQAEDEVRQLLAAASAADARFAGGAHTVIGREAMALDAEEPVLAALAAAGAQVLGGPPPQTGDIAWGDSGLLVEAGIPCPTFGPVGHGEHTADEWVDLDSVVACAQVLAGAARRFCAAPRADS